MLASYRKLDQVELLYAPVFSNSDIPSRMSVLS